MKAFVGVVVVLGLLVVLVAALVPTIHNGHEPRSKSKDNIRTMLTLMIGRRAEKPGGWPAYTGKNFILSLVATNQLDRRNKHNLEVLWPPRMSEASERLPPDAYAEVTKASLKTRRFPHLTGYAGRCTPITPEEEKRGTPLIADLTHPDGVIIGYSNGAVRFLEWEDLDMAPPEGPLIIGPKSKHPILRLLSDE
jgi:hypothetical protein